MVEVRPVGDIGAVVQIFGTKWFRVRKIYGLGSEKCGKQAVLARFWNFPNEMAIIVVFHCFPLELRLFNQKMD